VHPTEIFDVPKNRAFHPELMMTIIIDPDYPKKIFSFTYRGFDIEIDIDDKEEGEAITYAAWVGHHYGWAIATPAVNSRSKAIQIAKQWVDRKIASQNQ